MNAPVLTYRLQRSRLWLLLGVLGALVLGGVFARAWSRTPDRPWFALLLVPTVFLGVMVVRTWLPRWHTAEVLTEPPRLRVRSLIGTETFDLTDAVLVRHDVTVTGRAPLMGSPILVKTSGKRSDLTIRTPERSLVVHARGRRRHALAQLADGLQQVLGVEVTTVEETRARLSYVGPADDTRTVQLNPDVGSQRASHTVGLVALVVLGMVLLGAAAIAVQDPPYEDTIVSSAQHQVDRLTDHLTAEGVDLTAATDPVEVAGDRRDCPRDEAWLWGESGDVARVAVAARVEVEPSEMDAVHRRLDERLERQEWSETESTWVNDDPYQVVTFDGDQLELAMDTACLRPDQHDRAEADLSALAASWLSWLVDTSER